jgi:hypothetical protein
MAAKTCAACASEGSYYKRVSGVTFVN